MATYYYGPQLWTGGTFSVTGTDTGDANYPFTNYREDVKTTDSAGPNGERILDAVTSSDYDTTALDEEDFGPSSGHFDARGLDDGNGVFYEGSVKFSSAAEAVNGNFNYPFNVCKDSMLRLFWQVRVALTEGKLYINVRGDGEEATTATLSADDAWHTIKVQIVPSSDEGSTADGTVRVWLDGVQVYENLASFAWVNTTGTAYMLNYVAYGHYGLLPSTNWRIYVGSEDTTIRGSAVFGENTTVTATRAIAFGLDGNTNTHSEEGKFKVFGDMEVTGTMTLGSSSMGLDALSDVTLTSPSGLDVLAYNGSAWVNSAPVVRYAEVAISSAELLALRATPKTLVAAPGAGRVLEFVGAVLLLDATATAYVETADNLAIRYTNGSGTKVSEDVEATGFIDQTADTLIMVKPAASAAIAKTASENCALVLHNIGDSEYTTGTGTMRAKVAYRVWSTGW